MSNLGNVDVPCPMKGCEGTIPASPMLSRPDSGGVVKMSIDKDALREAIRAHVDSAHPEVPRPG